MLYRYIKIPLQIPLRLTALYIISISVLLGTKCASLFISWINIPVATTYYVLIPNASIISFVRFVSNDTRNGLSPFIRTDKHILPPFCISSRFVTLPLISYLHSFLKIYFVNYSIFFFKFPTTIYNHVLTQFRTQFLFLLHCKTILSANLNF